MSQPEHIMQCSEVWGGNDEVDRAVTMPGLDAWVMSRPSDGEAAGGDIHYLSSCATGRITRILVADVAGHGAAVAALAVRLRTLMRRYVNYVDQTRLMAMVNREFAALGQEGRFATAIAASYWSPTGELEVTNAGHPTPFIYRSRERAWAPLARSAERAPASGANDLPLGVIDDTTFQGVKLRLEPGDAILLYTDAMIEAKSPTGEFLGSDGLLTLLRSSREVPGESLARGLIGAVRAFAGDRDLDDDATLLLIRPNGVKAAGSIRTGLSATFQIAGSALRSLVPGGGPAQWPEQGKRNVFGAWFDRFNRPPSH